MRGVRHVAVAAGSLLVAAVALLAAPREAHAATPLLELSLSPDVTVSLGLTTVEDEDLAVSDLVGATSVNSFPNVPAGVDVIAHHRLGGGEHLIALDTAALLPGASSTVVVARVGDVIRFDGSVYSIELAASTAGIPSGVAVDAISVDGSDLLLSFDRAVAVGNSTVNDEDLASWNGSSLSLFFDGSAAGVVTSLDLDGAHWIPSVNSLLLSFDGSGIVDMLPFDDEDVLERDTGGATWEVVYDASTAQAAWGGGPDVDTIHAVSDADGDGLSDDDEAVQGTDPFDPDSDGDGLLDGDEVNTYGTDPLDPDSDSDGFNDGAEVAAGSDPLDPASTPLTTALPALHTTGLVLLMLALTGAGWIGLLARSSRASRKET